MFDRVKDLVAANRTLTAVTVLVVLLVVSSQVRWVAAMILRAVARLLLLLALIALVSDGTRWVAGGDWLAMTSLLEHWQSLSPASVEAVQRTVTVKLSPLVWDKILLRVLRLPAWLVLVVAAMVLAQIGRRRQKVRIYANA